MRGMTPGAGRLRGVRERFKFWLRVLKAGLDPVDMLARFIAIAVLLLGIAGITVKLVFHLPWLVVVVILMAIALAVFAEGAFRVRGEVERERTAKRAEQQSQHQLALDAQQQAHEKDLASALALKREEYETKLTDVPAAVTPAEWEALCRPAGPDRVVFKLRRRFGDRGAFRDFNLFRCIVADPDGITTESDGLGLIRQYIPDFPDAPPVRPGRYRSEWRGRASDGRWVDITRGECEVEEPVAAGDGAVGD